MNRKITLLVTTVFLSTTGGAFANASSGTSTASGTKPVQFYAGLSGGIDWMGGKRSEQILTGAGTNLSFSSNSSLSSNGISAKGIGGFLWTIPTTFFVLSPEAYFGRGNTDITLQASAVDPAIPTDKGLQSTLLHTLTLGFIVRAGFYLENCQNNLLYLLIGVDRSKFENKFAFSSGDVGASVPTVFDKRQKWLNSPIFGLGFERKFTNFKVGVDIRFASYSTWGNYTRTAAVSDDVLSIQFKPKLISTSLTLCYVF